jgi:microcystin-dependent protein
MSTQINFTDFINKGSITVEDDSNNNETSLTLVGRNVTSYGKPVNENFLNLLENFTNNSSPENPVEGQIWYDNTDNATQLKLYDGTQWVSASGLKQASAEPDVSASTLGDLWSNTSTQQLFLYSGSGWILVGPDTATDDNGGISGQKIEDVVDTANQIRRILVNYINGQAVSVVSKAAFTLKSPISGITTVNPGLNLSNSLTDDTYGGATKGKYYGTSQAAENLIINNSNVPATDFARLSQANTFQQSMRVLSNSGISIGESSRLTLSVSGSFSEIRNGATDGGLNFNVNNAGLSTTALRIYNDTNIAIGNASRIPTQALDVQGNIVVAAFGGAVGSITAAGFMKTMTTFESGGDAIIGGSIVIKGATELRGDVTPNASGTKNIGSAAFKFNNVYANRFIGSFTGDLSGNITGSASSAGKLSSPTTFQIAGDVTASGFQFDGSAGGLTKTFTTTLNSTFIITKDEVTTPLDTDEIIIDRGGVGLRKIQQSNLVSVIPNTAQGPLVPIGTILPFGGQNGIGVTPPAGWLFCNGAEYNIALYEALFGVIGSSFGVTATPTLTFLAPDMRGRTLLGHLDTATNGNRVLNDGAAQTIGNYGGQETELLEENQIPEHYHSLQGDAGTQFYAATTSTGGTDTASEPVPYDVDAGATGTGITRTEGIQDFIGQEPITTVTPFATVNFIIFTGVF